MSSENRSVVSGRRLCHVTTLGGHWLTTAAQLLDDGSRSMAAARRNLVLRKFTCNTDTHTRIIGWCCRRDPLGADFCHVFDL